MKSLRTYGKAPFDVAVVHGGPGAGGEMAPVARELASGWGVLEPFQTATSLDGQVEELSAVLEKHGDPPVVLIGFSWGAWLSFLVAAHHPALVKKLVLVGSGPFEPKYVERIQETRMNRLGEEERAEYESIIKILNDPVGEAKSAALARLGALASKTDAYEPLDDETQAAGGQENRFHDVLKDALELRRSGQLLELGRRVRCPVAAIHGDYDPHPAEGVQKPLSATLGRFRFVLLENCGHKPWIERRAQDQFYAVLEAELRGNCSRTSDLTGPGYMFVAG